MLNITVVTLFPQMFESPLGHSILKRAQTKGLISIRLLDPRNYTTDRHHVTDDYPYGGGQGMVMKPEPLVSTIEDIRRQDLKTRVVLLSPQGKIFTQKVAAGLAQEEHVALICGRYEGIDERVKSFVDEELSLGDFTLSGGEPAAMVVIDAVARLIPGVLGNEKSAGEESFSDGLLEYPQYTRPEEFRDMRVPEVLLSGDHEHIRQWRREASIRLTLERRPDLAKTALTLEERSKVLEIKSPIYVALLHHPVYDKNGHVVTTAITNMDIHDIARSAKTYGIQGFYVVTPVQALQKLARKIIDHWEQGYGSRYNVTRKEALALVRITDTLDDALIDIERECNVKPLLVVTSARPGGKRTPFMDLQDMLIKSRQPFLLILGTGWGLTEAIFSRSDYALEAIEGTTDYNHLSVRSAAAIIFDRLLGGR